MDNLCDVARYTNELSKSRRHIGLDFFNILFYYFILFQMVVYSEQHIFQARRLRRT